MKVWELIQRLERMPAGADVLISKGETSWHVLDVDGGGLEQEFICPVSIYPGRKDA